MFLPNPGIMAAGVGGHPAGQRLWTEPGTYSWVVPEGVLSICAVVIGRGADSRYISSLDETDSGGGGGLAYGNDIIVTPGETLTVNLSAASGGTNTIQRGGLRLVAANSANGLSGGNGVVGAVLRQGGRGASSADVDPYLSGGGAAGYTGNGGSSGPALPDGYGGGGTSPMGGGAGGAAGGNAPLARGGAYGGGGAALDQGGPGCVRIIWGPGRAFPNTNTGDL